MKKITKNIVLYVQNLWDVTRQQPAQLSCLQRVIFLFLCCLEKFYRFCFFLNQKRRRLGGGIDLARSCVISVGNLTTGGTGKSVVVSFLVEHLGADSCAVILRGYARQRLDGQKNAVVSCGKHLLIGVDQAGDEAFMIAQHCGCSVAVGADRVASYSLLMQQCELAPRYIILDDAYQNHQLKKDCEILLLDARAPFDNGHCLPAGRLREVDYSRADFIILTHADKISALARENIKKRLLVDFQQDCIVCVRHAAGGVLRANKHLVETTFFANKSLLVFAGIGSFDGFCKTVESCGITIGERIEFDDHHAYSKEDVERIIKSIDNRSLFGAITTAKDWWKLEQIVKKHFIKKIDMFFVLPVSIEFLSHQEYSHFMEQLRKKIQIFCK